MLTAKNQGGEMTFSELIDHTFPTKVRCAQCGEMADYDDLEFEPDCLMTLYKCDSCGWWTEWEITPDDDDGIGTSSLYYRPPDLEGVTMWFEARLWPGFWLPDGLEVPAEACEVAG